MTTEHRHTMPYAMTFSRALEYIKEGRRVARTGWNGKDMFIFLVPGSTFNVSRPPLLGIYPEGTEIKYHAHIDMKTAQGYVVPWLASQADLLAEDWEVVGVTKIRDWPDLSRSKAALEEYDRTAPERYAMLDAARTEDDVARWKAAEKEAGDKVRDAFWEDTKDRNSRETIMRSMPVVHVRGMVGDWERRGR